MVADAGLRGRGGAGFATARKMRSVAEGRRRPVVVANGTEGEPASDKDAVLLARVPHLVVDGAMGAAAAVGADRVIICVDRDNKPAIAGVRHALAERAARQPAAIDVRLCATPPRYVAGEEMALVHFVNAGPAKPTAAPPRPYQRGVDGRPTLVQNVEMLAHLTQIATRGADWFRQAGTDAGTGAERLQAGPAVGHLEGVRPDPGPEEPAHQDGLEPPGGTAGEDEDAGGAGADGRFDHAGMGDRAAHREEGCARLVRRGSSSPSRPAPAGWPRRHASSPGTRPRAPANADPACSARPIWLRALAASPEPAPDPRTWINSGDGPRRSTGGAAAGTPTARSGSCAAPSPCSQPTWPPMPAACRVRALPPHPPSSFPARAPLGDDMTTRPATARTLQVDMIACDGHGICAELLPEWIRLDDWGYPILRDGAVSADLVGRARWAVANCPVLALRLQADRAT